MAFTWGVEFETNLIYHDKNGKNRQTLWEKDKLKITSETWDVKLHSANPGDGKYWINGIPEEDSKGLYNLEAQIGVFNGFSLSDFDENVQKMDKKLKDSITKKRFKTEDGTKFKLFGYDNTFSPDGLFLDLQSTMPGAYPDGTNWVGYRENITQNDIVGKPQLTMALPISSIPVLFSVLENYYPEEFRTDYATEISKRAGFKDNTLYGFVLYLCHYYGRYLQFMKNKDAHHYFKTVFWLKPRTNPSSLYSSLTKSQQSKFLSLMSLSLSNRSEDTDEFRKYIDYIQTIIRQIKSSLSTKDCLYSSGIPGINNSLYHYDKESIEMFFAMENHPDQLFRELPCVDPYEHADDMDKDPLPTLSSDENGEEFFSSSNFTSVWEWRSTGKGEVVYEFRDLQDLFSIALDGQGDLNEPIYRMFFETDMYTPSQLSEMMRIIFNSFFRYIFSDVKEKKEIKEKDKNIKKSNKRNKRNKSNKSKKKKTAKKTKKKSIKCAEGKHRSRVTGRCRTPKRKSIKKKCADGKHRSRLTGRCRSAKSRNKKKCDEGKRRSRVTGRCRSAKNKKK